MYRYLLNVSYIGTRFRGAQKQVSNQDISKDDPTTVQGCLEIALRNLKSLNYPFVTVSSRTDTGVHALHTTFHVDLERRNGEPYVPQSITHLLNKCFGKTGTPIRALKTFIVPSDFHCRKAESRTYMYRFAVAPSDYLDDSYLNFHIPIEELERCHFISTSTFDIDTFREGCQLFEGFHDFRTFMHKSTKQPDKETKRIITRIELQDALRMEYANYSWPSCRTKNEYKYYNFFIQSKGFLYNQVRRIVGALVAVAKGKVTARDIKFMLEVPSHKSWDPRIRPVPAYGLYLCEVKYSPLTLQTFKDHL